MAHHKFHGHKAIDFTDHQKHSKAQAIAGKFKIQAYESVAKVPFEQTENQAKANSTYQGCQGIKTERITGLPVASQANEQVHCQVLKKKYENRYNEEI